VSLNLAHPVYIYMIMIHQYTLHLRPINRPFMLLSHSLLWFGLLSSLL